MLSFENQKLLISVKSDILMFSFMGYTFYVVSKKSFLQQGHAQKETSRSFTALTLTFRSMIHFEIIDVFGMRYKSKFPVLHMDIQLFKQCLLKRFPSLVEILWPLCQNSIDHKCIGLPLDCFFLFH